MIKPQTFRKKYLSRPKARDTRESAYKRGYDARWRRFRLWFLSQPVHALCVDCKPRAETATEVHHIKPLAEYPELKLVESNCMGLCKQCHSRRTGSEG